MLTVILLVIIVLLILLLASMTGLALKNAEGGRWWQERFDRLSAEYRALEEGRDEESEAYEQQYLSFMETIGHQSTAIDSYIEDLHFLVGVVRTHYDDCLPNVGFDEEDRKRFSGIEQGINLQTGG